MNPEGRENENDRIMILDNEDTEDNVILQNDMPVAIANEKPKKHFIEPVLFFLFVAFSLFETIIPNSIEIQFCRSVLNVSEANCLNTTQENLVKLQEFTSKFQLIRSVIEVTVPSVISFFVGPWSDTYGRKPLIISAMIGYGITYGLWTLGSTVPTLDPVYFLFFSVPLAFSGGSTIMILGTFCYVCDVTTLENRGARLGRLQASLFFGSLIGTQLCPPLVWYGYTVVFGVATVCVYFSLIYAYFCIDESIVPSQIELNSVNKNPFNMEHVRGLFDACYTRQSPKVRFTLFLFIAALGCSLTNVFGESNVMYLFLQNVLGWELGQYTTLCSFVITVNAIGAYAGAWLLSYKLKLDDLLVLSLAAFLRVLSALVMIFGYEVWHIYFSKLLACTLGLSGPLIRSFLSRIVAKDELGKVFSLLASTESMTPLFASLTYTSLYEKTLSTFPGAVFYLSALFMLAMLGIYTVLVEMYGPKVTIDGTNRNKPTVSPSPNRPSINTQ